MTPRDRIRHTVCLMNKTTNILKALHLKWIDYLRQEREDWIATFEPQMRRASVA